MKILMVNNLISYYKNVVLMYSEEIKFSKEKSGLFLPSATER